MARTDNKGGAELRTWELNDNSTRYDYLLAAPSDEELTKYWTAWAVISTLGGSFVAVILLGILSSPNARGRPFNLYLIYLMIPDAVYSILCGIVCALHAAAGHQLPGLCNFQMMFIVWGVGSNMYLNAAVSHQIHQMLQGSDIRRKYRVPSPRYVTLQAVAVYILTLFLGTWGLIENQHFPHYVASTSGLACLPVEHSWQSSIFFWLVFFPLFGGLPICYIKYVCYDIWKRNLLPPAGKRRLLAIYFGRIVVVFVLMWVPYMILLFMFATWMPTEVHFYGGTLSHLQGAASASLCLLKPDVAVAVKEFLTCKIGHHKHKSWSFELWTNLNLNNVNNKSKRNVMVRHSSWSLDFFSRRKRSSSSSATNNKHVVEVDPNESEVEVLPPTPFNTLNSSGRTCTNHSDGVNTNNMNLEDSIWPDSDGEYRNSTGTLEEEDEDEDDEERQHHPHQQQDTTTPTLPTTAAATIRQPYDDGDGESEAPASIWMDERSSSWSLLMSSVRSSVSLRSSVQQRELLFGGESVIGVINNNAIPEEEGKSEHHHEEEGKRENEEEKEEID